MVRGAIDGLQTALAAVRPPPRLVDWSIFVLVCFEAISGLVSFTVGSVAWWPLFWAHRIAGLALLVFVGFKLVRVRHRLTNSDQWRPSTLLSGLTVLAVFGSLATGIVWVFGLDIRLSRWTLLSVHVGFGLVLVPLMLWHLTTRFRLPRSHDFDRRRTVLQYTALLIGATLVYRGQEFATQLLDGPGSDRRFTGSQPREGAGNESFPVTSWVADDPDPVELSDWTLSVRGAVETPLELQYHDLSPTTTQQALLDCTSGWYTVQQWRGLRVGDVLEAAGVDEKSRFVRFVSVTGYRWSLPIDEARDAVLATHVGGERLTHGHGAPLRLVAPGRRGFQWVKWIDRIDVRHRDDPAQWLVTLISGFD